MNNIADQLYYTILKNNNTNYKEVINQQELTFTELNLDTYLILSKKDKEFIFPKYINNILKFEDGSILLIFFNEIMSIHYLPLSLEKSYYIFDKIFNYKKEKKESIFKIILKLNILKRIKNI